jgi:NAD(P)-dependent dehydrogenase (short-subunit alcohol dehydrogenase family)
VEEVRAAGGEAVANGDDVADWQGAQRLIQSTLDHFGRLDVLVNNAGILRDGLMINLSEADWDAIMRVHLKGTFAPCHFAARHWRGLAKAGEPPDARIINTTSGSGLYGNVGQSHYGAAKAGIASFTLITARELERYGITVNAITPGARTRMSEDLIPDDGKTTPDFDFWSAENVAPLVVWLGSSESEGVTGRIFEVRGGVVGLAEGWTHGPSQRHDRRWDPDELGPVVRDLLAKAGEPAGLEV